MSNTLKSLASRSRTAAKNAARKVIRYIPPPKRRLSGKLAIYGGMPVRKRSLRPWPEPPFAASGAWSRLAPVLKHVFTKGEEGLPQNLARRFAEEWARYCAAKHCLLLPHGTDALRIGVAA